MEFNFEDKGDYIEVTISGRIDVKSSQDLSSKGDEVFKFGKKVVFEMSGVQYVSSAGIRVFMRWVKIKRDFDMKSVREDVKQVFELTGIDEFLNFV